MRRLLLTLMIGGLLALPAPAFADHATGVLSNPVPAPLEGAPVVEVGDWNFIGNFPAGAGNARPIGVDVEPYTRTIDGTKHKYLIMSSTTMGFSIFDVTDPATPTRVGDYGAAVCGPEAQVQQMIDALSNGRDFANSGAALGVTHGWENDVQVTPNGEIAILGTDAPGRCHDPVSGGMEIVDISDPAHPTLLGLVRLTAESHNVTVDLDRPWIVYNSNSDTAANNFIDIVDMKSCLALDAAKCLPHVARYQFKDSWTAGTESPTPSACHDLTYMQHKLWGACINTTLAFDPKNVWTNGHLSGTDLTDPKQVGEENACPLAAPSPEAVITGIQVVDCTNWTQESWKEAKLQNANLKKLVLIRHGGINISEDDPPRKDIQISHKSDPGYGGKLLMVGDERGGGTNTPDSGRCPGGGVFFYDIRDHKNPVVAKTPKGRPAVFFPRKDRFVQTQGANCTAHLFWEWRPENHLIAMAWYSSGTQVFRYKANFKTHPATVEFYNRKSFVPPGASTWTSRIYDEKLAEDGSRILYFTATDIARGFDFFTLTLPPKKKG
jgi:LVIVD repeat-containing protein